MACRDGDLFFVLQQYFFGTTGWKIKPNLFGAFSENNLTITSNSPEGGESRETMAINYGGEEVSIAFNPQFFIDPLKALDVDEVYFEFTDQLSPGVIKANHPFLYVIMPMRTT